MTTTLSSPLEFPCGQIAPNRIMKSALSETLAARDGEPTDRLLALYDTWAQGGFGLSITGNIMIDPDQRGEPGNVVICDDRHLERLGEWARIAQSGGSRVWAQINHPGRQANHLITKRQPVAPSAIISSVPGLRTPRELTSAEVHGLIASYGATARVLARAGFDGVQIQGAHGYLVSQFLSPRSNRRTDEWGGDIDNRMRFLLEIVREIRRLVPSDFAVGLKLNSADFQRGGFTDADSRSVITRLADEPIDLIELSGGSYESPAMMGRPRVVQAESTREREAYFLDYAQAVRETVTNIPLAVTGGFRSETAMTEAVASGACDFVGLGRPPAINPSAADAILSGRTSRLHTKHFDLGLPGPITRTNTVRSYTGAFDLQWHTQQLRRMGEGLPPDAERGTWASVMTAAFQGTLKQLKPAKRNLR